MHSVFFSSPSLEPYWIAQHQQLMLTMVSLIHSLLKVTASTGGCINVQLAPYAFVHKIIIYIIIYYEPYIVQSVIERYQKCFPAKKDTSGINNLYNKHNKSSSDLKSTNTINKSSCSEQSMTTNSTITKGTTCIQNKADPSWSSVRDKMSMQEGTSSNKGHKAKSKQNSEIDSKPTQRIATTATTSTTKDMSIQTEMSDASTNTDEVHGTIMTGTDNSDDKTCPLDAIKDHIKDTEDTVGVSTAFQPTSIMPHSLENQTDYEEGKSSSSPMPTIITTTVHQSVFVIEKKCQGIDQENDELKHPILESLEQNKDSFKNVTSKAEYDKDDLIQADLITEGFSYTTKEKATLPSKQFNSDGSDTSPIDPPQILESSICVPDVAVRIDTFMQDEPQQNTSGKASTILVDKFGSAQEYMLLVKETLASQGSFDSTKNDHDSKPIQVSQHEQEHESDTSQPLEDNLSSAKTETGGERDKELLQATSQITPENTTLISQESNNKNCKKYSKQKSLPKLQKTQKNKQPQAQNPTSLSRKDTRAETGGKSPKPKTYQKEKIHYKNQKHVKNSGDILSNSESTKKLLQNTPSQTKMKSRMMKGKDSKPFKKIQSSEGSASYIQKGTMKQKQRASDKRGKNHRSVSDSTTEDEQNISGASSQVVSNHLIHRNLDRDESGQLSGRSGIFQVLSLTPRGSNEGGKDIPADSSSSGGGDQQKRANRRNEKAGGNSTPRQNKSDGINDEFGEEEGLSLKEDEPHKIQNTSTFLHTSNDFTEGACGYTNDNTKELPPKHTYKDTPKPIDRQKGQKYQWGLIPKGTQVVEHTTPKVARQVDQQRVELSQTTTRGSNLKTDSVEDAIQADTGSPLWSSKYHSWPECDNLEAFCPSQPLCDTCHPEKYVICHRIAKWQQ